ncbi:methyl transferase [Alphabaculovirus altersperidaniae]|uniref:Methyl transferase n=1 Tax=Spodoptera eridania nucleopolyhedrovirus TaxID=2315721 RepID=A0ABX6TQF1_9ABAC|nr:methyl transferase [Spodoptera eridania nucleopolyhedrovirus]QNV47890.1 methyl transferase [Spodoptera eridania nucleopolyhedrovirus]
MDNLNDLKKQLNLLKDNLNEYHHDDIRRSRQTLEGIPRRVRNRCYLKIQDIDKRFKLCRNVDTFLDLCGGPGQFAKYMFDVNADCLGYGVTLRNDCDYTFAHPNFRKMYGCFDTGDIFDTNVLFELMYFCRNKCQLVMADGAFDVTGNENDQESLTFNLIRKECSIIMNVLQTGGNCVLKIFDTFDTSTISLLLDFVSHFNEYSIYKPPHSRAANSEKYLVCKGKLANGIVVVAAAADEIREKKLKAHIRHFAIKQKRALEQLLHILKDHRRRTCHDAVDVAQL